MIVNLVPNSKKFTMTNIDMQMEIGYTYICTYIIPINFIQATINYYCDEQIIMFYYYNVLLLL